MAALVINMPGTEPRIFKKLVYKIKAVNYSSKDDVLNSINELGNNITAHYFPMGTLEGELHIQVPHDFDMEDALMLGSYIGQIQTMKLM
jgi:hypothetical protein